jgi:hypothetical protein
MPYLMQLNGQSKAPPLMGMTTPFVAHSLAVLLGLLGGVFAASSHGSKLYRKVFKR